MAKFNIIQDDPYHYKTQILSFWEEYLPGTPPERLEWMQNNPAGSSIWLFAFEEKTGKLAGMISLFPKDLFFGGKRIQAAILGDFMLDKQFRVFGPALNLLKAAVAFKEEGKFDFLYTIPNSKSKKLIEKTGFSSAGKCYVLLFPQRCDIFLEKYVGCFLSKVLKNPVLFTFKLFSRATYVGCSGIFEEIDWHNEAFNEFCAQLQKSNKGMMTGDYSLSYLDWRYGQNPEFDFRIIICRKQDDSDIQGFFVFSLYNHRLELYDIVALNDKIVLVMIKKICLIAKKEKCRAIYMSIYEHNPLLSIAKRCCFIDTNDKIEIFIYPSKINGVNKWHFFSADRNI